MTEIVLFHAGKREKPARQRLYHFCNKPGVFRAGRPMCCFFVTRGFQLDPGADSSAAAVGVSEPERAGTGAGITNEYIKSL